MLCYHLVPVTALSRDVGFTLCWLAIWKAKETKYCCHQILPVDWQRWILNSPSLSFSFSGPFSHSVDAPRAPSLYFMFRHCTVPLQSLHSVFDDFNHWSENYRFDNRFQILLYVLCTCRSQWTRLCRINASLEVRKVNIWYSQLTTELHLIFTVSIPINNIFTFKLSF